MSEKIEVFAPAKINLYLHILGKRPDGFHELETLMVPISLGDTLLAELTPEPGISLACDRADLPADPTNLVHRAAILFIAKYGLKEGFRGVRFDLRKKIPVGAGLGGGSSDGAHALLALRRLTGQAIPDAALEALAAELGSDVPFFIAKKPAVCRGRGEILSPLADWKGPYHGLLVHPGFGVPTPWAYKSYAADPRRGVEGPRFDFGVLRNDLEPPAFAKYLWLPAAKEWLAEQPEVAGALMSGSGSSVFALLKEKVGAEALGDRFRAMFGASMFVAPFETLD